MKVAIAILLNTESNILITRRAWHGSYGGYWEFPGGQVEADETPEQALAREMQEELNIIIQFPQWLGVFGPLLVYLVRHFEGEPVCQVGQLGLRWEPVTRLRQFVFPPSNEAVIHFLEGYFEPTHTSVIIDK